MLHRKLHGPCTVLKEVQHFVCNCHSYCINVRFIKVTVYYSKNSCFDNGVENKLDHENYTQTLEYINAETFINVE